MICDKNDDYCLVTTVHMKSEVYKQINIHRVFCFDMSNAAVIAKNDVINFLKSRLVRPEEKIGASCTPFTFS